MQEEKSSFNTRFTFEDNKIIIESTDKEWLAYIKTELLTKKSDQGSLPQNAKKFIAYCWRKRHMQNVITTLVQDKKVTFKEISTNYNSKFGKKRGLSGVMSGLTRNAARAELKKDWLKIEHNGDSWVYSINERLYPIMKAEVARLKQA